MTQTATFPDLESNPALSDQAVLYFSATMGTLTEVDVVTSGSFTTQFSAENLGPTSATIKGTTIADLSINVPTGPMPVNIPPVTETFDASAYDGTPGYVGTSGTAMAPVTSSSTPQTTVLTSPADLAAFTGFARIPISVSGHATGSATSSNGDASTALNTQTSATITVIYHYIPNLPGTDPAPGGTTPSPNGGGTSATDTGTGAVPGTSHIQAVAGQSNPAPGGTTPSPNGGGTSATDTGTGAVPGTSHIQAVAGQSKASAHHAKKHAAAKTYKPAPHRHPHPVQSHKAGQVAHSRHYGPGSGILY
jgi:hypothetical protein